MAVMTIKAEVPVYGGRCIGKLNGKVVMIKGVVPGETVEAAIEEEKKDYSLAQAVSILDPSPDRITPECIYFGECGGCQLQHIAYSRQVRLKEEILKDCIKRIAQIDQDRADPEIAPSMTGVSPWHYRLRGQFKIAHDRIGFYREKSRELIDISACPLMAGEVNRALERARALLGNMPAGELHISSGNEATALLKAPHSAGMDWNRCAQDFLDNGFSGAVIQAGDRKTIKRGKSYLTLDLQNLKYTVSPLSFFQSHWSLNQAVVRFLIETLKPLQGQKIIDLCSGAGNFSIPLAMGGAEVIAVEESAGAVEDGRRNARVNGIGNCLFIKASMDSFAMPENIDTLIIDPPRPGLTNKAAIAILNALPERIAYLSCNPATLARDLKKLLGRYMIDSLRMIDFFPQTYHIESLVLLRLK